MADVPEPTVRVVRYEVCALPDGHSWRRHFILHVEWRGNDRWAVTQDWDLKPCLASDGQWDFEPRPSERTPEWAEGHYFDLDTALRLAKEAAPELTMNGYTPADMLARDGKG